jgi:hypothetical protein
MKITVRLTGTGTHLARRLAEIAARRLQSNRLPATTTQPSMSAHKPADAVTPHTAQEPPS